MSKSSPAQPPRTAARLKADVAAALAWLRKNSSPKVRDGMARYGLPSDKALGVSVGNIQKLGKQLGKDHELAGALWETDVYEARLLVAYVGDPAKLTPAQMDRWCRDFDNWGVVDTICFVLFNQSPHAWKKIEQWCKRQPEFERRAGFVLLACLPWREEADDARFLRGLELIEQGATDGRNFVKKGVNWALRSVGRRSRKLHTAATALAQRLAGSDDATARWVGKDAFRQLTGPAMLKRIARL
ncbi:MAG TPA: DNA alkylation repair protein [Lacunisphaera sp.]